MKRYFTLILCLCLLFTGCTAPKQSQKDPQAEEKSTVYVESMDTFMNLTAYGSHRDEALKKAESEIYRLNDLLSVGVESSEVSTVNREGTVTVSGDTAAMLTKALNLYRETEGAFDITIYPLMELWGFTTLDYHVPTDTELATALDKVGSDRLTFDESNTLTLGEGQSIDLGGIAKGYTSQRIMELFKENGVESGMVSLGGNVQCLGCKPDGTPWKVGIRDPLGAEDTIAAAVSVTDCAVITSGGYERYFTDASGVTYQHIIDPATGYPVDGGLSSVTIVTPDGMLGDGLSTSLYIMGLDKAADYWRSHSGEFEAVFIDGAQELYVTEGLKNAVSSTKTIHIIPKAS